MAGHSQFKNIMFRKNKQDAQRSKLFSKLSREITVSAKLGMPDPAHNPRLRAAIAAAKAQSMSKDVIERAIKKALGGDAESYDEVRYEGFGPGGIAIIVEALTDNRNRTAADIRAAFSKYGGALGENGSVAFMFHRMGSIMYPGSAGDADAMLEAAIEVGRRRIHLGQRGPRIPLPAGGFRRRARRARSQARRAPIGQDRLETGSARSR